MVEQGDQSIIHHSADIVVSSNETKLSAEQASLVHSRYLGLLKTYGVLDREEFENQDGWIRVFTERNCPIVQKDFESTQNDRLWIGMTIRLHTYAVDKPFKKGDELPTDVADDVVIRLAISVAATNVFTVFKVTKHMSTSFLINPDEVQYDTFEEVNLIGLGVLGRGSGTFKKLLSIADLLEKEYSEVKLTHDKPSNDKQPPQP